MGADLECVVADAVLSDEDGSGSVISGVEGCYVHAMRQHRHSEEKRKLCQDRTMRRIEVVSRMHFVHGAIYLH